MNGQPDTERGPLSSKAPARRYLILASQCSGGDYLCRRLACVQGRFGLPGQYLDPGAIQVLSARFAVATSGGRVALSAYLAAVERAHTTADGWFGLMVQPWQLLRAVGNRREEALNVIAGFDRLALLTRRGKLDQAVAATIANRKETWSGDGPDAARIATLLPMIAACLSRCVQEERFILDAGRFVSRPLLRIEYEEIEQDGQAAFMNLVEFLGGENGAAAGAVDAVTLQKPEEALARKAREYFLEFIAGSRACLYLPEHPARSGGCE